MNKNSNGKDRIGDFQCRSAVGSLPYLGGCTRLDASMSVHQAAKFNTNTKHSHDNAVKRVGRYLKGTNDKVLILKTDLKKGLEIYVNADFACAYDNEDSEDPSTVYSRTGFIIKCANCSITWKHKLQTEIALSTTEAEHIDVSTKLKETTPIIQLL